MTLSTKTSRAFLKRVLLAVIFLASPAALYAQGCAMCYQSAAASGPRSIHALKQGILILMIPPVLITGLFAFITFRKRDQFTDQPTQED
jgi:hypothetical protein